MKKEGVLLTPMHEAGSRSASIRAEGEDQAAGCEADLVRQHRPEEARWSIITTMDSPEVPLAAQKRWVEQWKRAAVALAEQRRRELSELTEEQALAASEALLSIAPLARLHPSRRTTSGLVEQQALFHRRPTK